MSDIALDENRKSSRPAANRVNDTNGFKLKGNRMEDHFDGIGSPDFDSDEDTGAGRTGKNVANFEDSTRAKRQKTVRARRTIDDSDDERKGNSRNNRQEGDREDERKRILKMMLKTSKTSSSVSNVPKTDKGKANVPKKDKIPRKSNDSAVEPAMNSLIAKLQPVPTSTTSSTPPPASTGTANAAPPPHPPPPKSQTAPLKSGTGSARATKSPPRIKDDDGGRASASPSGATISNSGDQDSKRSAQAASQQPLEVVQSSSSSPRHRGMQRPSSTTAGLNPPVQRLYDGLEALCTKLSRDESFKADPLTPVDFWGSFLQPNDPDDDQQRYDFFDTNNQGDVVMITTRPIFPEEFPPGMRDHSLSWWGILDPALGDGRFRPGQTVQDPRTNTTPHRNGAPAAAPPPPPPSSQLMNATSSSNAPKAVSSRGTKDALKSTTPGGLTNGARDSNRAGGTQQSSSNRVSVGGSSRGNDQGLGLPPPPTPRGRQNTTHPNGSGPPFLKQGHGRQNNQAGRFPGRR